MYKKYKEKAKKYLITQDPFNRCFSKREWADNVEIYINDVDEKGIYFAVYDDHQYEEYMFERSVFVPFSALND